MLNEGVNQTRVYHFNEFICSNKIFILGLYLNILNASVSASFLRDRYRSV